MSCTGDTTKATLSGNSSNRPRPNHRAEKPKVPSPTRNRKNTAMTSIDRRVPSIENRVSCLVSMVFLIMVLRIENSEAFSFRSLSPTASILSTQTRYNDDGVSTLKAAKSSNVVSVTDSNYRELFRGEKPLLLDAYAQWCGPCKLIEPVLEQCADDWKDSIVVGKFDVEDSKGSRDLKVELILQGVMPRALPALILVHDNKVLDTWKGVISPTQLQEMLEKHVVRKIHVVGIGNKNDLESSKSKKGTIFCENGVCKVQTKANNHLENDKSRPFRGIGLINDF